MKTALCIGTNYSDTSYALAGCLNDVDDWGRAFREFGFSRIVTLKEQQATGAFIRSYAADIVSRAKPGDTVVIQYSGHGTQIPDVSGDEPDKMDEAWVPNDVDENGLILDDELWQLFKAKKAGVKLVILSDSCHSGSVVRAFGAVHEGRKKFVEVQKSWPKMMATSRKKEEKAFIEDKSPWPCLLMSGCQDVEFSYDATFNERPNGAFTRAALDTLRLLPPKSTYNKWFLEIRKALPSSQYPQTPRLAGSYINAEVLG